MTLDWQSIVALTIVFLTLAAFIIRALSRKKKPGCGKNCGCGK
ncbi:FeoB-associated Cys-rich membrane protein [Luteolibacter pohnpeiensis]|uniref:FeoB-associated Cys-rich membrane protein n=1 Tax=Luteolibacter pohnpeiensis TaxID=454153 RepID=A0A934S2G1_9BACT|nr:FeoB-associated Cys-rich membrane protein [Luteolibacter pohnpeiensis]MBK1881201.1 FeoB-associated Cys-rich membrane protein [Luteolibacter pohnpeiensis]